MEGNVISGRMVCAQASWSLCSVSCSCQGDVDEDIQIEEGLLAQTKYSRQAAVKFMYGEEPPAQTIADMYKERINHLLTFDKFARLEMKFF